MSHLPQFEHPWPVEETYLHQPCVEGFEVKEIGFRWLQ